MEPTRALPWLLPDSVPLLDGQDLGPFLHRKDPSSLVTAHARGAVFEWLLPLRNHGLPGRGFTVELRGPALERKAFRVVRLEAFFPGARRATESRLSRLRDGVRGRFERFPLQRTQATSKASSRRGGRGPRQLAESIARTAVLRHLDDAGPCLRLVGGCLVAPPRRAIPFHVTAWPSQAPAQGFTMSCWFGHSDLRFTEFA